MGLGVTPGGCPGTQEGPELEARHGRYLGVERLYKREGRRGQGGGGPTQAGPTQAGTAVIIGEQRTEPTNKAGEVAGELGGGQAGSAL